MKNFVVVLILSVFSVPVINAQTPVLTLNQGVDTKAEVITRVSADERWMVVKGRREGLSLFDVKSGRFLRTFGDTEKVNDFAFDASGNLWVLREYSTTIFNCAAGRPIKRLDYPSERYDHLVITPDGLALLLGKKTLMFDAATFAAKGEKNLTPIYSYHRIVFDAGTSQLLSADIDGKVNVYKYEGKNALLATTEWKPTQTIDVPKVTSIPDEVNNRYFGGLSFYNKGKQILCLMENSWLIAIDIATQRIMHKSQLPPISKTTSSIGQMLAVSHDEKQIVIENYGQILRIEPALSWLPKLVFNVNSLYPPPMTFLKSEPTVITMTPTGLAKVDVKTFKPLKRYAQESDLEPFVAYQKQSQTLHQFTRSSAIKSWQLTPTFRLQQSEPLLPANGAGLGVEYLRLPPTAGQALVVANDFNRNPGGSTTDMERSRLYSGYDLKTKRRGLPIKAPGQTNAIFLDDQTILSLELEEYKYRVVTRQLQTGKEMRPPIVVQHDSETKWEPNLDGISNDGKYLALLANRRNDKKLALLNLTSGAVESEIVLTDRKFQNQFFHSLLLAPDHQRCILYMQNGATVFDFQQKKEIAAIPVTSSIFPFATAHWLANGTTALMTSTQTSPSFTFDLNTKVTRNYAQLNQVPQGGALILEDRFYAFYRNGGTVIFDLRKSRVVATIYSFEGSADWVAITPTGRFDGTPAAFKRLYFVKGLETIELDAFYEQFYTPRMIQRVFAGEDLPAPDLTIDNIVAPPIVRILPPVEGGNRNLTVENDNVGLRRYAVNSERVQITVEATTNDDAVSEIRLFHNGKAVESATRNLSVEDDKAEKKKTKTFDLQLTIGDNHFRAIAVNMQRTESRPDEIVVSYKPVNAPVVARNEVELYLLVIGINQYKNPRYNLNYATADAMAFKEAIESRSQGIFGKVNAMYIGDAQATKEGITAELEKIKAKAQPKDVFMFYYAGHGVMNEKKEFFVVPHDVTQLYGADEALAQRGLSSEQMRRYSREIKAQKQLFILDACQSAGALDQVALRGAAEEKAIAQLARSTGTHWLTASGSEQFAAEFKQLGHGTFTYVLLEALSGKADKGSDRKITVKELDAYLQEVVPEITAKFKGAAQYPASYGFGNDFPIGVVK